MTKLLFVRHGTTNENMQYNLIGTTDVPLNSIGAQQAACVAKVLQHRRIDQVLASPLQRAEQTAQIIAWTLPVKLYSTRNELREINLGTFEGLNSFTAYNKFPDILDRALDETTTDFAFPGGELRSEALHRFSGLIQCLVNQKRSETICIITHGGLLGLWFAWLNHQPLGAFRKYQPKHGSITEVEWADAVYNTVRFNDCAHLNI